jgi:hypothetical protein
MEANLTSVRPPPRDWAQEYAELSSAEQDLGPEDLERYSVAAHLLGRDEQPSDCLIVRRAITSSRARPRRPRAPCSG